MKATSIAFERRYCDDSGVEFAVRLIGDVVQFQCVDKVDFPVEELDWLITALARIKAEVTPVPQEAGNG